MASSKKSKKASSSSLGAHSSIPHKTRISINVYDLLPPSKITTLLFNIGTGLVHSGVVIGDREYAFGAHQKSGVTGVYYTRPGLEPPGGTFHCEILQGFSLRSQDEIDAIIFEASHAFLGPSWNLLKNNCNHFTSYLCEQLTSRPAPSWLNRAANIGMWLPCLVPKQWIDAPDAETADGELLKDDDGWENDDSEQAAMLLNRESRDSLGADHSSYEDSDPEETDDDLRAKWRRKRRSYKTTSSEFVASVDDSGREIPVSERAPIQ